MLTVNKVVYVMDKNYRTDEEARLDGARIKNMLQAQDPNHEYWFDYTETKGE
jgi:hypothetical protein